MLLMHTFSLPKSSNHFVSEVKDYADRSCCTHSKIMLTVVAVLTGMHAHVDERL